MTKALGVKVFASGLIVLLVSAIASLYFTWYQFDMYVVKEIWTLEEAKRVSTGYLFSWVFFVVGLIIMVTGMLIILRIKSET